MMIKPCIVRCGALFLCNSLKKGAVKNCRINISETKLKYYANNELLFLYHQMKQKIKRKRRIELWQNQS